MRHSFIGLLLLLGGLGCATMGLSTETAVIRAKNRVAPAVVHIRPVKEVYAQGRRQEMITVGSGFIISPDGYVVTNEHVAGNSRYVTCILSTNEEVEADVVGVDAYTDVALLKVQAKSPLPYVSMGNSDALEAGETVLALGSPHGLSRSVSLGIISVTDRYLEQNGVPLAPFNNWIQTDAAINMGNSGGPLVNLRGEVIGVNTRMLLGAENIGFAIPINVVKEVVEQIKAHGTVKRAWLGLEFQEIRVQGTGQIQEGVLVADVDPLSPAAEAKIQPGDILLAVNGEHLSARFPEDVPRVNKRISELPIGMPATLSLLRGEQKLDVVLPTIERPPLKQLDQEFAEWGFTASDLTPEIIRRAQLTSRNGVYVSGTQVGGMAHQAGLSEGDIILEMDGKPVENIPAFRARYEEAVKTHKKLVLLWVKRGALTRFVIVKQVPTSTEGGNGDATAE